MTDHPACLPPEALLAQCDVERTRRGGPGGQHRNKVETAIVLRHRPTGVVGQASERRSQDLNRQAALERLRIALALEVRTSADGDAPPSALWQARAMNGKLAISGRHADFPALLSEALDRLTACDWDLATAADRLDITSSQLVKLLQIEPAALALLNEQRAARGLLRLK